MSSGYFKRNRKDLFPWIEDFSDPQDFFRSADVSGLSYKEWFWFHSSAFSLINVGQQAIGLLLCGGVSFFFRAFSVGRIFCLVLAAIFAYFFLKKCLTYSSWAGTTFYDMYVRDYDMDGGEK